MSNKSGQRRKRQPQTLSNEELRSLVVEITNHTGVEAFVRRMMKLHDGLKTGRLEEVRRIVKQSKIRPYERMMTIVSDAVKQKRINMAVKITFYASLYAYENSEDHGREFMRYLDRLRNR